jgi:hypothetical protein
VESSAPQGSQPIDDLDAIVAPEPSARHAAIVSVADDSQDDSTDDIESADVATLDPPPNLPALACVPMPRTEDGDIDWTSIEALTVAVQVLLQAGLAAQARPLADELASRVRRARGPVAEVIALRVERDRRRE